MTPAPLRYWQYDPSAWFVVVLVALLRSPAGWATSALATARVRCATRSRWPALLGVVVLLFSTGRLTVTDSGCRPTSRGSGRAPRSA